MDSPFYRVAPALRENGYSVIPILPKQKRPAIEKWSDYCVERVDEDTFARWMRWQANGSFNVGVCMGAASGVIGLDLDDDVEDIHKKILDIVPPSPLGKRGAKGVTYFYQYNGQGSHNFAYKGAHVLDILSHGRQTVVPPSLHPSGVEYAWLNERSMMNMPAPELPHMSLQQVYGIGQLLKQQNRPFHKERQDIMPYEGSKLDRVAEAIKYIEPHDYDVWIRIGMSLKHHYGDTGFHTWDLWSRQSDKYDAGEMAAKWASFRGQGLTLGTLFYYAFDGGYTPVEPVEFKHEEGIKKTETLGDREIWLNGFRIGHPKNMEMIGTKNEKVKIPDAVRLSPLPGDTPTPKPADPFPLRLIDGAPGLIRRVYDFIEDTALIPQPVLSLAASISLAGSIMGRKCQSPTGLRTNHYIMGLAPSGSGKDHARNAGKNLLHNTGLGDIELAPPASSAGLLSGIRERGRGRGLIIWDEFGRILKQTTHWKAGTHEKDIITTLMELFSSAQSVYMGKGYANHDGKNPIKPIIQPHVGVYATTVPNHFYEALSATDAIDGFLSRWLVFESKDYVCAKVTPKYSMTDIPEMLQQWCAYWKQMPDNFYPSGNVADATIIKPKIINYGDGVEKRFDEFFMDMRSVASTPKSVDEGTSSIFARLGEHAIKIALTGHNEDGYITMDEAEWAIAVADWCGKYMTRAIRDYVSSTELEASGKNILRWLRDKTLNEGVPWVNKGDITRRFSWMPARIRGEILNNLLEMNEIECQKTETEKGRPVIQYRAKWTGQA